MWVQVCDALRTQGFYFVPKSFCDLHDLIKLLKLFFEAAKTKVSRCFPQFTIHLGLFFEEIHLFNFNKCIFLNSIFHFYYIIFYFLNIIFCLSYIYIEEWNSNTKLFSSVQFSSVQFSSVAQSCPTLCDPMNRHTASLPVSHKLPELTQTYVHRVGDAIQLSHPLSSPSPLAPNPSQHQGLFQWVNSSHEVAKILEFQLQHQSFQWTPRTDLL